MPRLFGPKPRAKEPEEPKKVEGPPPSPTVTKDELAEILGGAMGSVADKLAGTMTQLNARIEELANRQPQVVVAPGQPTAPVVADISDQDIENAILSGQGAAAHIRGLVDRAVTKATQQVIEQHVKPLQDYGVATLGDLSHRVMLANKPYYNKFKKEIDQRLGQLSPDVRANPQVIDTIYNSVVGLHSDELARDAVEAAIRQQQEQGQGGTGTGAAAAATGSATAGTATTPGTSRDTEADVPDFGDFTGDMAGAKEALGRKGPRGEGYSQDEFARSMGYADWSDYIKQYNELLASETKGSA